MLKSTTTVTDAKVVYRKCIVGNSVNCHSFCMSKPSESSLGDFV